jgi:exosome complex exonuclease RRP6
LEYNFYHANVARPQLKFKTPPDNVNGSPWRPLLKEKPNAMVPLDSSLTLDENGEESLEYTTFQVSLILLRSPQNPYRHEIINSTYPPHVFNTDGDAIPPVPLETNDLIWVDNLTSFNAMLNDLKQASDIAVDLEHHDYRSYHGFVCLMQISTRKQDWIVDTLELREELIALNEVFTDPKIVKVIHYHFT